MKKTKYVVSVLLMAILVICLVGCGKKKDVDEIGPGANNIEDDGNKNEEDTSKEEPKIDSMELYEAFIGGTEKVFVEEGSNTNIPANKDYSLKELLKAFADEQMEGMPNKFSSLEYAYVDCGMDNEPELALKVVYDGDIEYETATEYFIIKRVDDRLKFAASCEEYYRSSASVNKYGIIRAGGSCSAYAYVDSMYVVNDEGKQILVYTMTETMGLAKPIIVSDDLPSDIKLPEDYPYYEFAESDDEYYSCQTWNFEAFNSANEGDEWTKDYDNYRRKNFFAFYDYDGKPVGPSDEYKEFYDENGIVYYVGDDLTKVIDNRYNECGVKKEMIVDDEPEWKALEIEMGEF